MRQRVWRVPHFGRHPVDSGPVRTFPNRQLNLTNSLRFIYMHNARWPLNPKFDSPQQYGLEAGRARNLELLTRDNVTLGAWHILPNEYYEAISSRHSDSENLFADGLYDAALGSFPTVIFLHGNAASRAVSFRVQLYRNISREFGANVVAIDYRGFADSSGRPSEQGLVLDARAAWDWVHATRARLTLDPELWGSQPGAGITLFGQSLGTAVAAQLMRELALEHTPPQGVVLAAPFSSLREVVTGYGLMGFPIFGPLDLLPAGNCQSPICCYSNKTNSVLASDSQQSGTCIVEYFRCNARHSCSDPLATRDGLPAHCAYPRCGRQGNPIRTQRAAHGAGHPDCRRGYVAAQALRHGGTGAQIWPACTERDGPL